MPEHPLFVLPLKSFLYLPHDLVIDSLQFLLENFLPSYELPVHAVQ